MRIYEQFVQSAGRHAQRLAMIEQGRTSSYSELLGEADALGDRLRAHGLEAGDTVAIQFPNSIVGSAAILAASKLAARIMLLDAALKPGEVSRHCALANARLLVHRGTGSSGEISPIETFRAEAPALIREDDDVVLLLSSGTTGVPKIVCRTADAAVQIFRATLPIEEGDRILAALPFYHSFGFYYVLISALASGATLYVASFSPRETTALIEHEQITVLPATPFVFRLLAQTYYQRPPDFSSVRLAVSAGSALPPGIVDSCREKFGIGVAQSYGSTESGPVSLARFAERDDHPGWVGRPYVGVTVEILGPSGEPVAPNVEGEIAVQSRANFDGYLHAPEVTASIFKDDRVLTGDLGYLNEAGHLFVIGRRKSMLNIAGKKVSPSEVEACLLNHPAVADVLVAGTATADGDDRIKATVVASSPVTALQLQEFCASQLADFKVPRQIEFVEKLERGPMGKVAARP